MASNKSVSCSQTYSLHLCVLARLNILKLHYVFDQLRAPKHRTAEQVLVGTDERSVRIFLFDGINSTEYPPMGVQDSIGSSSNVVVVRLQERSEDTVMFRSLLFIFIYIDYIVRTLYHSRMPL